MPAAHCWSPPMFDAFLAIYRNRTRDLLRIATGGTGILPLGDIHPDLVERLAQEASKTARHLLLMCIRAIDYCPPVDVTYGDYMRAMITADFDLVPEDDRNYRVAIIEAFRAWGIYPEDVRTLSVESLRWKAPPSDKSDGSSSPRTCGSRSSSDATHLWTCGERSSTAARNSTPRICTFRKYTRMEVARKNVPLQGPVPQRGGESRSYSREQQDAEAQGSSLRAQSRIRPRE